MLSQRGWAIILFLNVAFVATRIFLLGSIGNTKYSYIEKDYPLKLPIELGQVQATFGCSVRYTLNSSIANEIWVKSTDARTSGFVRLGPDLHVFSVSMFHELHCISTLGRTLYEPVQTPTMDAHVGHCLNYLRMFTMCAADATEEPLVRVDMLKNQGCAPSFIRRCSNWNTLYDFLARNYLEFHRFKALNGTWNREFSQFS